MPSDEGTDYAALADQELALAASAADQDVKTQHLNRAAYLATLCERSRAPHAAPPASGFRTPEAPAPAGATFSAFEDGMLEAVRSLNRDDVLRSVVEGKIS
jgi:hypothetical protein